MCVKLVSFVIYYYFHIVTYGYACFPCFIEITYENFVYFLCRFYKKLHSLFPKS